MHIIINLLVSETENFGNYSATSFAFNLIRGPDKGIFLFLALTNHSYVSLSILNPCAFKKLLFSVTYSLEFHFCKMHALHEHYRLSKNSTTFFFL
jgi:hypothetical protein